MVLNFSILLFLADHVYSGVVELGVFADMETLLASLYKTRHTAS